MAYLGSKPANQVITSEQIADGVITPADLSTGRPYWDTSGNVGIGTTSPLGKFAVNNNGTGSVGFDAGTVSSPVRGNLWYDTDGSGWKFQIGKYQSSTFTPQMTFDDTGNVGIGMSPSAWGGQKVLQLTGPSLWGSSGLSHLTTNTYFDGSNYKYIATDYATDYYQYQGTHVWRYAASGTAGANTTFTEAMKLDSTGKLNLNGTFALGGNNLASTISTTNYLWCGSAALAIVDSTGNSVRQYIDGSGAVYINRTTLVSGYASQLNILYSGGSTRYGIMLQPSADNTTPISFINASGGIAGYISQGTSTVAYNQSSDYRLKENIQPMVGALDLVLDLKPCTYVWKADGEYGQGFIAHELQEVIPTAVTGEKDGIDDAGNPKYQGVDYSKVVATLTAAIQELKAELDATKAEIALLKGTN